MLKNTVPFLEVLSAFLAAQKPFLVAPQFSSLPGVRPCSRTSQPLPANSTACGEVADVGVLTVSSGGM
jgi:hypothetical protein